MGTVTIFCDFGTPIDTLRQEIQRLCAACADWDGRRCEVAVVDTTDQKIQIRTVVSASSAEGLWRLRCELREKIVTYLAANEMGRSLSRVQPDHALGTS